MVLNKKGQGLSLNVIIIAALALIVLVVLAVIFTGSSADFDDKTENIAGDAKLKLTTLALTYSDCQPSGSAETKFMNAYSSADTPEDQDDEVSNFKTEIDRCKDFGSDKLNCEGNSGCIWG
ncbi:hypothetical protein HOD05_02225 [Candidatus Woesearchaeota archaeon]|jgi:hypothetical protein|nr:hypothetical protein [Candidatus Woesearchaeota archaeon]MBT4150764.1 hypothetical protein [Candidatus Woesearchaeota archaeon]MBT4247413.1 hypothetical protein [Candidatus Woesearchaeota archaeon]MBT4434012.1 hypothetical protein [Candidatus Woesearchaeota archaeon]MBT7332659.1 hypothetical protein [Candidatus Woesearchaeota archaeon]